MKWKVLLFSVLGLLLVAGLLAGCGQTPEPCPECPACPACPETECPEAAACPECPQAVDCPETAAEQPYAAEWAASAHADVEAEAFNHWNEDDPAEVPTECAKCHSEGGFIDFLGADGTAARLVENSQPIGTVVTCIACHNEATETWDSVVFPSGIEITGLGSDARCMECHQGRASTLAVDSSIAVGGVEDMDTVSADLGFTNIHYNAAAATMYGTLVQGGYEYEGKAYDAKHDHIDGFDQCIDCHDPHTLELKNEACLACHAESDPRDRRMMGSLADYDGDGNLEEGIYYEVEGLQEMLYAAIQAYANEVSATPVIYEAQTYPYFFVDSNGNGEVDADEATFANQYNAWTGRLAKAAYNYQTSLKDPGGYAHGGKYLIQLLYDSVENLNEALSNPVDLSKAQRIDYRHFAGSEPAFRHWDEEGIVPGLCARCHAADGLPLYLTEGVDISQPTSNGLNCSTCHDDLTTFSIYDVPWVRFPRGALIDSGNPGSNLCLNCHQGRSSIATINGAIAGKDLDTVAEDLEFVDIHFFAAAATLYGTEVQGAYEYADQLYLGRFAHVEPYDHCTACHNTHEQKVRIEECSACHPGVSSEEDLASIRMDSTDFDGDGDTTEGIAGELDTVRAALYAAIQNYALQTAGAAIVFEPRTYPYFFSDTNGDGQADASEADFANRYATWTPRLLRAAYNYQYSMNDPGAFAHNAKYVLQILHDSIQDMGGDVSGMVRPQTIE